MALPLPLNYAAVIGLADVAVLRHQDGLHRLGAVDLSRNCDGSPLHNALLGIDLLYSAWVSTLLFVLPINLNNKNAK
jgi:hypothetical protein